MKQSPAITIARCSGAPSKVKGILHHKCSTCERYLLRNEPTEGKVMWTYGYFDLHDECDIRIEVEAENE